MAMKKEEEPILDASTLREFVKAKVDEAFNKSIPVETVKELPDQYKYPFGTLAIVFMICTFCMLTAQSYLSSQSAAFLSLDQGAGICSSVSQPLTGTYLASTNGYWETQALFFYEEAMFRFTFQNFEVQSIEAFAVFLQSFNDDLNNVNQIGGNSNLGMNLVMWMTYSYHNDYTSKSSSPSRQIVEFTADAGSVFDRHTMYINLQSTSIACTLSRSIDFDTTTATVTVEFNAGEYKNEPMASWQKNSTEIQESKDVYYYDDYTNNKFISSNVTANTCNTIIDRSEEEYSQSSFVKFNIDMNAAMVAVAINIGFKPAELLEEIPIPIIPTIAQSFTTGHNATIKMIRVVDPLKVRR